MRNQFWLLALVLVFVSMVEHAEAVKVEAPTKKPAAKKGGKTGAAGAAPAVPTWALPKHYSVPPPAAAAVPGGAMNPFGYGQGNPFNPGTSPSQTGGQQSGSYFMLVPSNNGAVSPQSPQGKGSEPAAYFVGKDLNTKLTPGWPGEGLSVFLVTGGRTSPIRHKDWSPIKTGSPVWFNGHKGKVEDMKKDGKFSVLFEGNEKLTRVFKQDVPKTQPIVKSTRARFSDESFETHYQQERTRVALLKTKELDTAKEDKKDVKPASDIFPAPPPDLLTVAPVKKNESLTKEQETDPNDKDDDDKAEPEHDIDDDEDDEDDEGDEADGDDEVRRRAPVRKPKKEKQNKSLQETEKFHSSNPLTEIVSKLLTPIKPEDPKKVEKEWKDAEKSEQEAKKDGKVPKMKGGWKAVEKEVEEGQKASKHVI